MFEAFWQNVWHINVGTKALILYAGVCYAVLICIVVLFFACSLM